MELMSNTKTETGIRKKRKHVHETHVNVVSLSDKSAINDPERSKYSQCLSNQKSLRKCFGKSHLCCLSVGSTSNSWQYLQLQYTPDKASRTSTGMFQAASVSCAQKKNVAKKLNSTFMIAETFQKRKVLSLIDNNTKHCGFNFHRLFFLSLLFIFPSRFKGRQPILFVATSSVSETFCHLNG